MIYFKYLKYVIRHKWFVFLECCKAGIIWRGIVHDMSKLRPSEFVPYARRFYGSDAGIKKGRNKSGYYKPYDTGDAAFDKAWLLHQKRNKHHWQWWMLPRDDGGFKIFEMDVKYRTEMLCDWHGAGRAISGKKDTSTFYLKNQDNMQLGIQTRGWIESELKRDEF